MELFNKFSETIFLKEDTTLEKEIEELKQIREYVHEKEKIDRDIKLLEIGLQGEKKISFELRNTNIGMYVLHDITIECDGLKAQFDYIIITKGYIYLVECKNLIGNITVDNKGEFRREYELYGKKYKEAIYSPYTQANRHKEILKKKCLNQDSKFKKNISLNSFDSFRYKPLVVISNPKSLLNIKYAPKDIKENVVRLDYLIEYIKSDLRSYDFVSLFSKNKMEKITNSFLEMNISSSSNIVDRYKKGYEILERELKTYRKNKANKMNVPAYYIFNDDEMKKIILNKPNDIDKLKELNILSEVKLNLHGKEIIEIIKENT